MKLFTLALGALALYGAAFAASVDTLTAHFATPIMVGGKVLPAGDITFNVIHGTSSMLLVARTPNNEAAAVVVKNVYDSEGPGKSEVILGKTCDTLKLEKVWLDGVGYAIAEAQ